MKHEGLTLVTGLAGDRLGTRLVTCADGTVVAAAPGRPGVWVVDAGVLPLPRDAGSWTEVACVTPTGGQHWLAAAGDAGLAVRRSALGWQLVQQGDFLSLAGGPRRAPLLAGERGGAVRWFDADTAAAMPMMMMYGEGEVDSLAWFPEGDGLLVGSSSVSGVDDWWLDGGVPTLTATLFMNQRFGRAVLVGDVSPRQGLERVIAAEGKVWILDRTGATITVLEGPGDFGAALALSPSGYAGLQALWVSDPASNTVHFFIGDAGVDATPPSAAASTGALGASLAFVAGVLYVGAPQTSPGGAVVVSAVTIPPVANFEVRECGPSPCVQGQGCTGMCVGGVVCDFSRCPRPHDAGVDAGGVDAGAPDAGAPDAGAPDAGSPDAGSPDAGEGEPDAGPVVRFAASGCESVGESPLLLLLLAIMRRSSSK